MNDFLKRIKYLNWFLIIAMISQSLVYGQPSVQDNQAKHLAPQSQIQALLRRNTPTPLPDESVEIPLKSVLTVLDLPAFKSFKDMDEIQQIIENFGASEDFVKLEADILNCLLENTQCLEFFMAQAKASEKAEVQTFNAFRKAAQKEIELRQKAAKNPTKKYDVETPYNQRKAAFEKLFLDSTADEGRTVTAEHTSTLNGYMEVVENAFLFRQFLKALSEQTILENSRKQIPVRNAAGVTTDKLIATALAKLYEASASEGESVAEKVTSDYEASEIPKEVLVAELGKKVPQGIVCREAEAKNLIDQLNQLMGGTEADKKKAALDSASAEVSKASTALTTLQEKAKQEDDIIRQMFSEGEAIYVQKMQIQDVQNSINVTLRELAALNIQLQELEGKTDSASQEKLGSVSALIAASNDQLAILQPFVETEQNALIARIAHLTALWGKARGGFSAAKEEAARKISEACSQTSQYETSPEGTPERTAYEAAKKTKAYIDIENTHGSTRVSLVDMIQALYFNLSDYEVLKENIEKAKAGYDSQLKEFISQLKKYGKVSPDTIKQQWDPLISAQQAFIDCDADFVNTASYTPTITQVADLMRQNSAEDILAYLGSLYGDLERMPPEMQRATEHFRKSIATIEEKKKAAALSPEEQQKPGLPDTFQAVINNEREFWGKSDYSIKLSPDNVELIGILKEASGILWKGQRVLTITELPVEGLPEQTKITAINMPRWFHPVLRGMFYLNLIQAQLVKIEESMKTEPSEQLLNKYTELIKKYEITYSACRSLLQSIVTASNLFCFSGEINQLKGEAGVLASHFLDKVFNIPQNQLGPNKAKANTIAAALSLTAMPFEAPAPQPAPLGTGETSTATGQGTSSTTTGPPQLGAAVTTPMDEAVTHEETILPADTAVTAVDTAVKVEAKARNVIKWLLGLSGFIFVVLLPAIGITGTAKAGAAVLLTSNMIFLLVGIFILLIIVIARVQKAIGITSPVRATVGNLLVSGIITFIVALFITHHFILAGVLSALVLAIVALVFARSILNFARIIPKVLGPLFTGTNIRKAVIVLAFVLLYSAILGGGVYLGLILIAKGTDLYVLLGLLLSMVAPPVIVGVDASRRLQGKPGLLSLTTLGAIARGISASKTVKWIAALTIATLIVGGIYTAWVVWGPLWGIGLIVGLLLLDLLRRPAGRNFLKALQKPLFVLFAILAMAAFVPFLSVVVGIHPLLALAALVSIIWTITHPEARSYILIAVSVITVLFLFYSISVGWLSLGIAAGIAGLVIALWDYFKISETIRKASPTKRRLIIFSAIVLSLGIAFAVISHSSKTGKSTAKSNKAVATASAKTGAGAAIAKAEKQAQVTQDRLEAEMQGPPILEIPGPNTLNYGGNIQDYLEGNGLLVANQPVEKFLDDIDDEIIAGRTFSPVEITENAEKLRSLVAQGFGDNAGANTAVSQTAVDRLIDYLNQHPESETPAPSETPEDTGGTPGTAAVPTAVPATAPAPAATPAAPIIPVAPAAAPDAPTKVPAAAPAGPSEGPKAAPAPVHVKPKVVMTQAEKSELARLRTTVNELKKDDVLAPVISYLEEALKSRLRMTPNLLEAAWHKAPGGYGDVRGDTLVWVVPGFDNSAHILTTVEEWVRLQLKLNRAAKAAAEAEAARKALEAASKDAADGTPAPAAAPAAPAPDDKGTAADGTPAPAAAPATPAPATPPANGKGTAADGTPAPAAPGVQSPRLDMTEDDWREFQNLSRKMSELYKKPGLTQLMQNIGDLVNEMAKKTMEELNKMDVGTLFSDVWNKTNPRGQGGDDTIRRETLSEDEENAIKRYLEFEIIVHIDDLNKAEIKAENEKRQAAEAIKAGAAEANGKGKAEGKKGTTTKAAKAKKKGPPAGAGANGENTPPVLPEWTPLPQENPKATEPAGAENFNLTPDQQRIYDACKTDIRGYIIPINTAYQQFMQLLLTANPASPESQVEVAQAYANFYTEVSLSMGRLDSTLNHPSNGLGIGLPLEAIEFLRAIMTNPVAEMGLAADAASEKFTTTPLPSNTPATGGENPEFYGQCIDFIKRFEMARARSYKTNPPKNLEKNLETAEQEYEKLTGDPRFLQLSSKAQEQIKKRYLKARYAIDQRIRHNLFKETGVVLTPEQSIEFDKLMQTLVYDAMEAARDLIKNFEAGNATAEDLENLQKAQLAAFETEWPQFQPFPQQARVEILMGREQLTDLYRKALPPKRPENPKVPDAPDKGAGAPGPTPGTTPGVDDEKITKIAEIFKIFEPGLATGSTEYNSAREIAINLYLYAEELAEMVTAGKPTHEIQQAAVVRRGILHQRIREANFGLPNQSKFIRKVIDDFKYFTDYTPGKPTGKPSAGAEAVDKAA